MKIRTDFVTNSSSANFILELQFVKEDGTEAVFSTGVSPETLMTEDGDMTGESIELSPRKKRDDIVVSGKSIFSTPNIDALCDLLISAATIEGWVSSDEDYDEDEYDDDDEFDDEDDDEGEIISVLNVAPKATKRFKDDIQKYGITLDNLQCIVIKNMTKGSGDCAMWVNSDNPAFMTYREHYQNAETNEEKTQILQKMVDFVKTDPVLEVNDNEGFLPKTMHCTWNSDDESLQKAMESFLTENFDGYWMGAHSKIFVIDMKEKKLTQKEVLEFGELF